MTKSKIHGFTLIELVMVIALIGILAAVAIPKFANLTSQGSTASAEGIGGALKSAMGIAHAQWIANGSKGTVNLEGTTVNMSTAGYPEYTTTAGTAGTMTNVKCEEVWNGVLSSPPIVSTAGVCTAPCVYQATASGSTCTYTDDAGTGPNNLVYDALTGAVTVTVSGI